MIGALKPYPEYKDSGVPWLGRIPAHWAVLPNRAIFAPKVAADQGYQNAKKNTPDTARLGRLLKAEPFQYSAQHREGLKNYWCTHLCETLTLKNSGVLFSNREGA